MTFVAYTAVMPDKTLTPDEVRILNAMRDVRRGTTTFRLRTRLYSGDEQLDQGQADALDLVVSSGTCRMVEVAEMMKIDPSTATRAIARLVDAGLVEREPSPTDRRSVLVRATPEGIERHRRIDEERRRFLRTVFDRFESEEVRQLATLLCRLVADIDEAVDQSI